MAGLDQHKKVLENTLNSLSEAREGSDLERVVKQTKLDIFRTLGNTLFVDAESLTDLESIGKRVAVGGAGSITKELTDAIALMPPPGVKSDKRDQLNAYLGKISGAMVGREAEFNPANAIVDTAKKFETNINVLDVTLPGGSTIPLGAGPVNTEDLDTKFTTIPVIGRSLELYDDNLTALKKDSLGKYILSLPTKTGSPKNVAIDGMDFSGSVLRFDNIKLLEPGTGSDIRDQLDLSKEIKLPIGCILNAGGKQIAHQKILKFKLHDPLAPVALSVGAQDMRYGMFNIGGMPLDLYTEDFYGRHYKEVENRMIDERIGNAVPDDQKKTLRDRIRNLTGAKMPDGNPFSPCIPETKRHQLGPAFKKYFFDNVKPNPGDISSPANYDMFLLREVPGALTAFLEKELKRQMESTSPTIIADKVDTRDLHTPMTREILQFRQEQEDRSKDEWSQSAGLKDDTKGNRKINEPRRPKLTRSGLWGIGGKKDVSYLRFFHNKTESIPAQKTRIVTDEKNNKVEDVGYMGDIRVEAKAVYANFKLDNGKEVKLHGGDQAKLLHALLNDPKIPYGKMRIHMAYNVIKAMIRMAQKNNISLEYADKNTKKLVELALDSKGDIVVQHKDETSGKTVILSTPFAEKEFALENNIHYLRQGIEGCMEHFNTVMNKTHRQYKKATEKSLLSYFKNTRMRFPTTRLGSPLKKLMNIRSKSRTLKFDFEGLSVGGYSVSFKKNKFTISGGTLTKPIASRDLGKLLNHRIRGVRLFDGVELEMVSGIYQELIKHLRQNAKLANTSFGVKDTIKQRVYFINETGTLCYTSLTAGDKNPIKRSFTSLWLHKNYGRVAKGTPSNVASTQEANEFYQNPLLMGKLMKAMNLGLYRF